MDVDSFRIPSPGAWEIESTHMQRPITRWLGHIFPPAMIRGFKAATARYGALLDHMEVAVIGGYLYLCPRPVGAPKRAKGPPPRLVLSLLAKLHPELRRRIRRSAEVFERKLWREDVATWDREWKPAIVGRNRELAAIDPATLEPEALAGHLDDLAARMDDALFRHHALNMCALVPIGDLIAHVTAWSDLPPRTLCALLRGTSPVSVGATAELERAVTAIRADAEAPRVLAGGDRPADVLARLCAHPGAAGAAVRAYVDEVAWRIPQGYDVADPTNHEQPEILVAALRTGPSARPLADDVAAETARVRDAIPEAHRAQFDDLLGEARFVYRIRDERGYLNDALATGLARRGLLAAGDRLVAAGKLAAREHAVDLTPDEVGALLRGRGGPPADEVAARAAFRCSHTIADAPPHLGFPPSRPPPPEWLLPPAARMARAIGVVMTAMFEVPPKEPHARAVRGIAASPGTYEGRARVVLGAESFSKIERGDVLVARMTCPSYNILLPLLGGIVTDRGGLLSHAAIVAREYGMPAVVGTTDATSVVPDGARVRIDGGTGEVQVLS